MKFDTQKFDNSAFITLDMDWASDDIIQYCIDFFIKNQMKSTWFTTHATPMLQKLSEHPDLFELGIHPNFLPNSTQGSNTGEIMDSLLKIVPQAKTMRAHSLYQSTPLFTEIKEKYSQIEVDLSLYVPNIQHVEPHWLPLTSGDMIRIPFIWEDDFEALRDKKDKPFEMHEKLTSISGIKVFNFHPIHIVLNTERLDNYLNLKKEYDVVELEHALKHRNTTEKGTQDLLEELSKSGIQTRLIKETGLYL